MTNIIKIIMKIMRSMAVAKANQSLARAGDPDRIRAPSSAAPLPLPPPMVLCNSSLVDY